MAVQTMLARRAERLASSGDKAGAIAAYMRAVRATPRDAEIHASIAGLLNDLGQHEGAIGAGLTATELAPDNARGQSELGRALVQTGQAEAALAPCARAMVLAPRNLGVVVTFGAVLFTLGRYEAALEAAAEAVSLDPQHVQARHNLALALEALGRLDEAEAQARWAVRLDPTGASMRHNLAGLMLSCGRMTIESWSLYDARLELTPSARSLAGIPRWAGEDVAGKTVLLHAEQGFGDTIQFARYAPMVQARGAHVVLAVPQPLLRLMQSVPGTDDVVQVGRALPPFDIFCPLASLPGVFGTTLETVPPPVGLPQGTAPLACGPGRVGLVWAGNEAFVHDRARSIEPSALRTLAGVSGVEFHSLQKHGVVPFPMIDSMADVADFADTAELIAQLDLVIAVDTAVAHLAATMGKPVWLLSRRMGCWRWLRDRDDSPWYPTMRIIRQQHPGDWTSVLTVVHAALVQWSEERAGDQSR